MKKRTKLLLHTIITFILIIVALFLPFYFPEWVCLIALSVICVFYGVGFHMIEKKDEKQLEVK